MSPDAARALFLPFHGVVGVAALVGGFGALAVVKGGVAHRRLGLVFAVGMALAIVMAVPVLVATQNMFLTGMGTFAGYMTWTGWRVARRKAGSGGRLEQAVSLAMMVGGIVFAAYGVRGLLAGTVLGLVPLAMGLGAAAFARQHWRWYRADRATRQPWVAVHLGAIGGGLIAGLTAFGAAAGTNYVPAVPEWILWLAPAAVLSPLLVRAGRAYAPR